MNVTKMKKVMFKYHSEELHYDKCWFSAVNYKEILL